MRFVVYGIIILAVTSCRNTSAKDSEWREYLGGPERNHYSSLTQIDSSNVTSLKVAWQYHTGDSGQMQCNPIIVNGMLYGMTASTRPFALDAATGKEIWKKKLDASESGNTSRGVTYWEKGNDKRIFFTNGSWLYACNALNGELINSFGDSGRVSLRSALEKDAAGKFVVSNSPGTIFDDLIIMPLRVDEGYNGAIGYIQAFNTITGKVSWVFRTMPHPGEPGYDTWPKDAYLDKRIGGLNNWPGMSIDRQRGLLFIPTGSAAFDFYGGNRKGNNLYGNSLLVLDAATGKYKWHFQFVHHDILDRDVPAPPNLITVTHNGKKIDAVAQITKQGFVFVFDRETGQPLFPIEERPSPASNIPGEEASSTQPWPVKPAPFARNELPDTAISPYARNRASLLSQLKNARNEGPFTPLNETGTIVFPGLDGGAEWGGAAVDPSGTMYVNSNDMAWMISLKPRQSKPATGKGELYVQYCAVCHGADRKGSPASGYPSLIDIKSRKSDEEIIQIISNGRGRMPAFTELNDQQKKSLVQYIGDPAKFAAAPPANEHITTDTGDVLYTVRSLGKFLDTNGLPAIAPPWGTLSAIDLNTGDYRWKIPFGEYPGLMEKNIPITGAESYGGPVVTASGILFIAGTKDSKLRVYDTRDGRLLWQTKLPAPGFAAPSVYAINGKQFVVIACGGGKLGAAPADSYVAFALP